MCIFIKFKVRIKSVNYLGFITLKCVRQKWNKLGLKYAKESSNYHTVALFSHASKVMLKILQTRLQQHMNHELANVQAGFRKGIGTRDQIANICWIIKKAREFQKNICSIDWLHQSLWLYASPQTVENS